MSYLIDLDDSPHGCVVRVHGSLAAARALAREVAKVAGHANVWSGSVLVAHFLRADFATSGVVETRRYPLSLPL